MIEWLGEAFKQELRNELWRNANRAGETLADAIRAKISIPVGSGGERSLPGEPPRTETGTLLESVDQVIAEEGENLVLIVGSPVYYSLTLEQGGISNWGMVEPRPFVVDTFMELQADMINTIIGVA